MHSLPVRRDGGTPRRSRSRSAGSRRTRTSSPSTRSRTGATGSLGSSAPRNPSRSISRPRGGSATWPRRKSLRCRPRSTSAGNAFSNSKPSDDQRNFRPSRPASSDKPKNRRGVIAYSSSPQVGSYRGYFVIRTQKQGLRGYLAAAYFRCESYACRRPASSAASRLHTIMEEPLENPHEAREPGLLRGRREGALRSEIGLNPHENDRRPRRLLEILDDDRERERMGREARTRDAPRCDDGNASRSLPHVRGIQEEDPLRPVSPDRRGERLRGGPGEEHLDAREAEALDIARREDAEAVGRLKLVADADDGDLPGPAEAPPEGPFQGFGHGEPQETTRSFSVEAPVKPSVR